MRTRRRDFIKTAGFAGTGILAAGLASCRQDKMPFAATLEAVRKKHGQAFNMCGYAAPKLDVVRI